MIFCPWCRKWAAKESFIELHSPPGFTTTCAPIYKHGGEGACKKLFSIAELA